MKGIDALPFISGILGGGLTENISLGSTWIQCADDKHTLLTPPQNLGETPSNQQKRFRRPATPSTKVYADFAFYQVPQSLKLSRGRYFGDAPPTASQRRSSCLGSSPRPGCEASTRVEFVSYLPCLLRCSLEFFR